MAWLDKEQICKEEAEKAKYVHGGQTRQMFRPITTYIYIYCTHFTLTFCLCFYVDALIPWWRLVPAVLGLSASCSCRLLCEVILCHHTHLVLWVYIFLSPSLCLCGIIVCGTVHWSGCVLCLESMPFDQVRFCCFCCFALINIYLVLNLTLNLIFRKLKQKTKKKKQMWRYM